MTSTPLAGVDPAGLVDLGRYRSWSSRPRAVRQALENGRRRQPELAAVLEARELPENPFFRANS